mmetsp:Transcript_29709/g.74698  ORF Transcript_29709/g.74698 Transcript_29709/m.74698 type:complete len:215 (-) Transcript_29709:1419-2063(-)
MILNRGSLSGSNTASKQGAQKPLMQALNREHGLHLLHEDNDARHGDKGQHQDPLDGPVEAHVEAHRDPVFKVLPELVHHLDVDGGVLPPGGARQLLQVLARPGVGLLQQHGVAPDRDFDGVAAAARSEALDGSLVDNLKLEHHGGPHLVRVVPVALRHKDSLPPVAQLDVVVADLPAGPGLHGVVLNVSAEGHHVAVHRRDDKVHEAIACDVVR